MSGSALDESVAAALHAARFGSLARLLISDDANASHAAAPDFYSGLMQQLSSLSDRDLDAIAVPLVREQIGLSAARTATQFFSSATGLELAEKLSTRGVPGLTSSEASALSEFSASEEGEKFLSAVGNPLLIAAIIQEIGQRAP